MDKNYKLSGKNSQNKWWTFGSLKKNQYGNYQVSIKITDEFKKLISGKEWINLSLFEDKPKEAVEVDPETRKTLDEMYEAAGVGKDDTIPF